MKCPSCDFENIPGIDRCENCMEPFRQLDVPQPREGFQAQILLDPIASIYSRNPASVSPQATVLEAVKVMKARRTGCVLVVDHQNLIGILSEVDVLFRGKPGTEEIANLKAVDLMTRNPEVVGEDCSIAAAFHLMSVGGYRHLPVVENGKIAGIVSVKDLLRYMKEQLL